MSGYGWSAKLRVVSGAAFLMKAMGGEEKRGRERERERERERVRGSWRVKRSV